MILKDLVPGEKFRYEDTGLIYVKLCFGPEDEKIPVLGYGGYHIKFESPLIQIKPEESK